jgi:hypothetical protein
MIDNVLERDLEIFSVRAGRVLVREMMLPTIDTNQCFDFMVGVLAEQYIEGPVEERFGGFEWPELLDDGGMLSLDGAF